MVDIDNSPVLMPDSSPKDGRKVKYLIPGVEIKTNAVSRLIKDTQLIAERSTTTSNTAKDAKQAAPQSKFVKYKRDNKTSHKS